MSASKRRIVPLNLIGYDGLLRPRKSYEHNLNVSFDREELSELKHFASALRQRTGKAITQKSIIRSALRSYLNKHRAWTEGLSDETAAD
jgi:hypothetical protein